MKRKVIKHGPSTLIVSLPSDWTKKHKISPGDELEITEKGKELLISQSGTVEPKLESEIDVTGLDRATILLYLRSFYRKGHHKLKINFNNHMTECLLFGNNTSVLSTIHKEVNNLIGVEVTQQGHNYCIMQDLSAATGAEFEGVFKRLFVLFSESLKDVAEDIEKQNFPSLSTIEERHNTITKFASYCLRLLNTGKYKNEKEIPLLYHTIVTIDIMVDLVKYFCRSVVKNNRKFGKEGIALVYLLSEIFEKCREIYFDFDLEKVKEFQKKRTKWKKDFGVLSKSSKEEAALHLRYLAPLLEQFKDLVGTKMGFD